MRLVLFITALVAGILGAGSVVFFWYHPLVVGDLFRPALERAEEGHRISKGALPSSGSRSFPSPSELPGTGPQSDDARGIEQILKALARGEGNLAPLTVIYEGGPTAAGSGIKLISITGAGRAEVWEGLYGYPGEGVTTVRDIASPSTQLRRLAALLVQHRAWEQWVPPGPFPILEISTEIMLTISYRYSREIWKIRIWEQRVGFDPNGRIGTIRAFMANMAGIPQEQL